MYVHASEHLLINFACSAIITTSNTFQPPLPYLPVTVESIHQEIGLVQNFYLAKLHANGDAPLVEDEDLPQKQRFPKPRLPPTGKISSPRKKPVREPGPGKGHPKKKMRMVEGEGWVRDIEADRRERERSEKEGKGISKDVVAGKVAIKGKLGAVNSGITMEREESRDVDGDPEDEEDAVKESLDRQKTKEKINSVKKINGINGNTSTNDGGMMSPESLEAI